MFADAVATVADYVSGLGLDAAKGHFNRKIDEKKLKKVLKEYIERQEKYNAFASINEEVDFQGLIEYIESELLDSVTASLFDPDPGIRISKKKEIIDSAISKSRAEDDEARNRVERCVVNCLEIIWDFYETQFDIKDYIVGSKIVDAIDQRIDESEEQTRTVLSSEIKAAKEDVISKIESNHTLISLDRALKLSEDGEIQEIGTGVQKMFEHISLEHPLYPYYGYDYQDGIVRSKALTSDAFTKYPSRLVLTGPVRFENHYFNNPDDNLFDYAYRHQVPMIMDVSKAVQYLGELQDPNQKDAEKYIGKTIIAKPPEFPPAFPCSIKIRDKIYFEYVLFRTQEIEDDGTYVIGNKEQNEAIYFEIRINPNRSKSPDYKMKIEHANNHELLKYTQFMYDLSKEKYLCIYVLSAKENLISGYFNNITLDTGFNNIEEELDFLQRICDIEDYFNVQIALDEEIRQNDYDVVCQLSDLIRNKEVINTWRELSFTKAVDHQLRDSIDFWGDDEHSFALISEYRFVIFGTAIVLKLMRKFNSVRIVYLEKLKEKLSILEDGDSVKITFQPGEDKTVIDTLQIPEEMDTQ